MPNEFHPVPVDKFLVVDDSSTNRLLLRAILQGAGFEVEEVHNGKECVEYCKQFTPRMVLLDIMMPEMNGIEACSILRTHYSKDALPVIMVTTKSESDDIALGLASGANDYVTKPVDRKILMARIETQLNHSEAHNLVEEQKRSVEEALRIQNAMGDVLPDGIAVTNNDGVVLYANDRLVSCCEGVQPRRIGEIFESIYSGRLASLFVPIRENLKEEPRTELDEEFEVFSGGQWNYRLVSRPLDTEEAKDLRVWLFRDLSEMRGLERKLNQQLKLDTVSTFAAGVAHNFNNMMGGVLGAAQLLRRRVNEDESCEKLVDVIEKAVASGARLTEKMSSLVRRDMELEGDHESVLRVLEIVAGAAECDEEMSEKAVTFHLSGDHNVFVNLSLKNLIDIFQNLIMNAVDAIDESGDIHIEVIPDVGGKFVSVRIADSGKGMNQEELTRIFEPFYSTKNLDERNKVSIEGNGLGMWNVYNLVKGCGGEIEVNSTPGEGTEIIIHLPLYSQTTRESEGATA